MEIKFRLKNLVNIVIAILLISYEVFMLHVFLYESPELEGTIELIITLFILAFLTFLTFKLLIINLIPRFFKEMRAVRRYITLKELNTLIKDEVFVPINLPKALVKKLKKKDIKYLTKNFLVSDKWICVDRILVPKKMVASIKSRIMIYKSVPPDFEIVVFNLANKYSFEFEYMSYSVSKVVKYLNTKDITGNLKNITSEEKYVEIFKEKVKTKEDFINFIR